MHVYIFSDAKYKASIWLCDVVDFFAPVASWSIRYCIYIPSYMHVCALLAYSVSAATEEVVFLLGPGVDRCFFYICISISPIYS